MQFEYKNHKYYISRYPHTAHPSLRAWNAGDEYLLQFLQSSNTSPEASLAILNDRFGFLSIVLHDFAPYTLIQYKSQEKAFAANMVLNKKQINKDRIVLPLQPFPSKIDIACIKVPKSSALFEQMILQLLPSIHTDTTIACAFMTRHFNPKILTIAQRYFEHVSQSKARKKSRLILLKNKKETIATTGPRLTSIRLGRGKVLQQYAGIFSDGKIDLGTRFLLSHLELRPEDLNVLDLASGNGVLASHLQDQDDKIELHLLEDDYLAVESAKLNLTTGKAHFHWENTLESLESDYFDLVVCNPPFHFEYENTIDIALLLFRGAHRCLRSKGRFVLVANRHLNYKTHLVKWFEDVQILGQDKRYIVYNCEKKREGI